jgi:integrase
VIKVASNLIEELRAYKKWQEHEAESAGAKGRIWENSGRIFTSATGGNINPGTVTSWFHKFVLDNELPYISIHGLRHTNASIMISRGVPITTAAKRLGHSTPATTAKIYAHEIDSVDAKTAEMFNDYFENKD